MARTRTGSIYKDKKGRIYARIQWRNEHGANQEIKRRADSRTHAREIIREELAGLASGSLSGESRTKTFRQVAAEYERVELVDAIFVNGRKVSGKKHPYTPRLILKTLVAYFGERRIQTITRPDIEEFRRERFATPLRIKDGDGKFKQRSIRSVNYDLQVLRAVFYFARAKRWLPASPQELFRKLILTSEETRRTRLLTPDEESRLLEACSGPRLHLYPLVVAALDTSLRKGALIRLTWANVDFKNRIILIPASESGNKRTAPMVGVTRRLEAELRELWKLSDKKRATRVFGIDGDFKKAWAGACKQAGISNLRFHDLRGCAATAMIMAGIPEEIVRKATGHARAAILRDHYIRANKDSIRRIADALDAAREVAESGYIN